MRFVDEIEVIEFGIGTQHGGGALSRLVTRVERAQETITQEFSLDHDGSALQRLSSMLEKTGVAVATSLTLDDEASPLARLKREILDVLEQHKTANTNFQTDVRSTLDAFKVRREEAARSTTHGHTFEACVGDFLLNEAQRHGDVQEAVGTTMGQAARKTGDHVLTLGPDSGAPEARIVCESKAKKGYTEKSALTEIALARKNRNAQVGLVIMARATAPEGIEALRRIGNDVLVVWDPDDAASDLNLRLAVSLARALCVRERIVESRTEANLGQLDDSIESIASQIRVIDEIIHNGRLIKRKGEKVVSSGERLRDALEHAVNCGNCYRSAYVAKEARSYTCTRCGAPAYRCVTCVRISEERDLASVVTTCATCSLLDEVGDP